MPDLVLWVRAPPRSSCADVLAGDRLDDVGTGDEHVGLLVDHDGEVGDRGGVDRAAGARAHDQRDLRDDAGGHHVAVEDVAVEAERDDALLDARAAGVVDADDRAAGLDGQVHDLDDLLAEHLAERSAEDREVLGEHADRPAVDRAVAGDDPVAVGPDLLQPEGRRPVPGQLVHLDERALVEQRLDPLAGGHLALGVLLLDRPRRPGVHRLVVAPVQVGELARGGVDVEVSSRDLGPWTGVVRRQRSCARSVVTVDALPGGRPATGRRCARRRCAAALVARGRAWTDVRVVEADRVDQRRRRGRGPRRRPRGAGGGRRVADRGPGPAGPRPGPRRRAPA